MLGLIPSPIDFRNWHLAAGLTTSATGGERTSPIVGRTRLHCWPPDPGSSGLNWEPPSGGFLFVRRNSSELSMSRLRPKFLRQMLTRI